MLARNSRSGEPSRTEVPLGSSVLLSSVGRLKSLIPAEAAKALAGEAAQAAADSAEAAA
jgi:hypothetical protein